MITDDEDKQKRELADSFVYYMLDRAGNKLPSQRLPSLGETLANRISEDVQERLNDLLDRNIKEGLPYMIRQAVQEAIPRAESRELSPMEVNLGRYGLIAVILAILMFIISVVLGSLFVTSQMTPRPETAATSRDAYRDAVRSGTDPNTTEDGLFVESDTSRQQTPPDSNQDTPQIITKRE